MNKRYSLKLGVGLISLVATGAGGQAGAHARAGTGTDQSFELAMAEAPVNPVASNRADKPKAPGRVSQKLGRDGLVDGGAYVEADRLASEDIKDGDGGIMHAYGNVLLRYKGQIIRADEVTYNSATHVTLARGHTQTINDDGSVTFADSVSYNDDGQAGVGENVATVGKDNAKVYARRVEQLDPDTNQLTGVIYTPCQLCVKKGETRPPMWSIEAKRIVQRHDKKMVYYNDATVKIHGVPVLYSPYLWTPDPDMDRASGFLQPKIGTSKKRGFSYEQPYLWSVSPYTNLIVSPQLNSSVNPLLSLELNRHFYSGELHVRYGFTNEAWFDTNGDRHGATDFRDYLLADGNFKINDDWRWAFTAQHVRDKNTFTGAKGQVLGDNADFFDRYSIENAFDPVGELSVDSRQLVNQFNITRQVENAYFAISMVSFQNLQVSGYEPIGPIGSVVQRAYVANAGILPIIAPQIEAYWSPRSRILGGQITTSLNAIGIQHKLFPSTLLVDAPAWFSEVDGDGKPVYPTQGFDTARISAGFSYSASLTTKSGVRWGPFVDGRYDYYHISDLYRVDGSKRSEGDMSIHRGLSTTGVNISYPLFRRFNGVTALIEPIAQLAVSPRGQRDPNIPNEDSQAFEFNETTLFSTNKSPGFDLYEGGARLNLGVRTHLDFSSGLKVETLVGRILRDKPETQFLQIVPIPDKNFPNDRSKDTLYTFDPTGMGSKESDWVVDSSFDTGKNILGYARMRIDGSTAHLSQGEVGLSVARPKTMGTLRYIWNDALTQSQILALDQPVVNGKLQRFGDNYRNLQLYGQYFFTKAWGVSARIDRDLVENKTRRSQVSLIYRDDCSRFELIYQHSDTNLTRSGGRPQSTLLFRLNLTTLGNSSSDFKDVR